MRLFTLNIMAAILTVLTSVNGQQNDNMFTFEQNDSLAEVNLYAGVKADKPVSRLLYGKFTEHLGHNVYHGLWAQIINNSSFEGWQYWGSEADFETRMGRYTKWVNIPLTDVLESHSRGVAPFWMSYGEGDILYEADKNSFNSDVSQKITVNTLQSKQAGIRQIIYLPLHRENVYELSFYARSERSTKLNISFRKYDEENKILSKRKVKVSSQEWKRYTVKFKIRGKHEKGTQYQFIIGMSKPGTVWLDQITLFPADNIKGFDPDVVRLSRESKLSLLRFPGGNFVSGYNWKDGIGPRDKRKATKNRTWNQIEYNHVGMDEYIEFCRIVGAEPLICINAGDGTPEEAAEWVEYANGSVDTKYGALRAKNGHPEPYNVGYWEIGNELWGKWQIGYTTPEDYADRYEKFYKAMKAVDPSIKTIANGQYPEWNAPVIERYSDILRSLSLHTVIAHRTPPDEDPTEIFESIMAYSYYYRTEIQKLADQMAEYNVDPKIAVTELQIFINDMTIPNNRSQSEAIFYSGILNSSIRTNGIVEMITHSALVNHGGGMNKYMEIVYPNPVYYARKIYSTQSGSIPIRINVSSPMYTSTGRYSPSMDVPYLDAIALVDDNETELNLILTNRHPQNALNTKVSLHDFKPEKDVRIQILTSESFMSKNKWDDPDNVKLQESSMQIEGTELNYSVPAHSIILLTFSREK